MRARTRTSLVSPAHALLPILLPKGRNGPQSNAGPLAVCRINKMNSVQPPNVLKALGVLVLGAILVGVCHAFFEGWGTYPIVVVYIYIPGRLLPRGQDLVRS